MLNVTRFDTRRRHGYRVTDESGQVLAEDLYGCTTILGQVVAKYELIPWSGREAGRGFQRAIRAANSLEDLKPLLADDFDPYAEFVETTRDKAGERGSDLHGACEEIGRARLQGLSAPEYVRLVDDFHISEKDAPLLDAYTAFLDSRKVKILSVEKPAACVVCGYGATSDLEAEIDGQRWTLDIKTGKAVYSDVWLQLCAQDHALSEISDPLLFHEAEEYFPQSRLGALWLSSQAKDGCELVENPCEPQTLSEALFGVMALWRWRQALPKNGKLKK